MSDLRKTPLCSAHERLGAKFTEFGGWWMPVQYSGVIDEHRTVREQVGLFDVSHMGEVMVRGPRAFEYLQRITTNDVAKLKPGTAQYSLMLNEEGGVVDDIIVYQLAPEEYLVCVNAGTRLKDVEWMEAHNQCGAELEDASDRLSQIAVQGPKAEELLERTLRGAGRFSRTTFLPFQIHRVPFHLGGEVLVARTGYTGEDGFEIFCTPEAGVELWQTLLEEGGKPIGLAARDTLRLEVCYPLYGHELREDIDPLTSGVGWVVKPDKGAFIGRAVVEQLRAQGGSGKKLVGLILREPGIAREGCTVLSEDGAEVGWVTSGTKTPTVNAAVALAFVSQGVAQVGGFVTVDVRGRKLRAEVVKTPFYRREPNVKASN